MWSHQGSLNWTLEILNLHVRQLSHHLGLQLTIIVIINLFVDYFLDKSVSCLVHKKLKNGDRVSQTHRQKNKQFPVLDEQRN